jgi:uncharacterized SAM-binding protein YcdF (DUF218 family)
MRDYIVIFGAAVRLGGTPSGTLARRTRGAWDLGGNDADICYVPTGAVGEHGPSEASVMRDLLVGYGVAEGRIILEERGTDTLSSVIECADVLEQQDDVRSVTVCTSGYHVPRCHLLFRLIGIPTRRAASGGDVSALGWPSWLYYVVREIVATPWDAVLMLMRR